MYKRKDGPSAIYLLSGTIRAMQDSIKQYNKDGFILVEVERGVFSVQ